MSRNGRCAAWLLALALATPAHAVVQPAPAPEGEVSPEATIGARALHSEPASALSARPAWLQFQSKYGGWKAQWSSISGSPHRAFGPPIRLASSARTRNDVDRLVREFVATNPGLFGAPTLESNAIFMANGIWYARYRQMLNGVPVLFTDWEFRVSSTGRLILFGADAHAPKQLPRTNPVLARAAAREQARAGLTFVPGRDAIEDGGVFFLPWTTSAGTEYRLVYEQRVLTQEPPGHWLTYVDARNGEVLWRRNMVRYAISGRVTGDIHAVLPTDPYSSGNFRNLKVYVGPESTVTNPTGDYSAPAVGSVTVTDSLIGLFCDVNNVLPSIAVFSAPATDPQTVDIHWNDLNSDPAERDVYFHTEVAHGFIKSLDPGFTAIDHAMPARVNINNTCNAFFDFVGINFFRAGNGCPNTATMPDVVYHEYGHGINHFQYVQAGSPNGMLNGALHEGIADITAAFIQDDPVIAQGFSGPGTQLRTVDNDLRWPEDQSSDPHITGLIIAGAFWDLRESIGLAQANHLAHFARYGIPDDLDDGLAMSEYFVETLIADDNDADLSNGTPHFDQIVAAFNPRGIGTGFFIEITHTALADQPTSVPLSLSAVIQYTGPVGTLNASSLTVHVSKADGDFVARPMTPTGNPNEFAAAIGWYPGLTRYYFTAEDSYGAARMDPRGALEGDTYFFLAGPATTVFEQTMETDPGWVVGDAGDDATTGIWVRGNPNGTLVNGIHAQPEDDHTPLGGTQCWMTGQHTLDEVPGFNDVDFGKTTLTSNTFDATSAVCPMVEYYRWYSNQLGNSPNSDPWRTYISNDDGANWVQVENTQTGKSEWVRVLVPIADYVAPTATMKLRFVAADAAAGSLVEAAVDDVRLLSTSCPFSTATGDPPAHAPSFAPPSPNPMRAHTTLRFTLPEAGMAALRVYDLHGRLVRAVHDGPLGPGAHSFAWDALDARGRRVPSGPYFVQLELGGRRLVQKVVRVE